MRGEPFTLASVVRERYEVLETLGAGGEARVVRALDRQHDRFVAMKIRPVRDVRLREHLLGEARILLALAPHPSLPLVREDFFHEGDYVVVMDWVDGTDLGRILRERGAPGLAPSSVLAYLSEAAEALSFLHRHDPPVVHGDVKPENLILTRGGHIKLVDFGLSSAAGIGRRSAGSPGYRAPELAAGAPPSRASDVYALAATAFALLTGAPPAGLLPRWDGFDPRQAAQLEAALRLGLASDPARRPGTPGELVERLRTGWGSTLPTGVTAFCLTDIVGSTPLWEAEPAAMAQALVRHDELIAQAVESHGGRFLKSMGEGDSTFSVFESTREAVAAAAALNRALNAAAWPGGVTIRVRCAIHTGEAEQRGGSYFGSAVNLAARIRGEAERGEILLSQLAAELVAGDLPSGYSLIDLGPHRLRGVRDPERIHALSGPAVSTPLPASDCPYRGLFAFGPQDRAFFFGREQLVRSMIDRLAPGAVLALVGASGSGKSSVLRAGVVAAAEAGEIDAVERAMVLQPGAEPPAAIEDDSKTLVVVDQFEELYTLSDPARREAFIESVLRHPGPVAIAVRADFYGELSQHPRLAAAAASNHVLLGPMSENELRRAVTEPARLAGLRLEPGLVDVILSDVAGEPGALPLLSHALRATWQRRDGRTLTIAAYRSSGGVSSAVARTADALVSTVPPERRDVLRNVFLRLTELGDGIEDTRRRVALDELVPHGIDGAFVRELLERFAQARLITLDDGSAEVAHEVLIREWPTLREWLEEDREGLRQHRRLGDAARLWNAAGRESADLYRGTRLAVALEWAEQYSTALNAVERAFLDASRAEAEQARLAQARSHRRLRSALAGMAALLLVVVGLGLFALRARDQAAQERATAQAKGLAAESTNQLASDPELAILLAREAVRRAATPEALFALRAALDASTVRLRLPAEPCPGAGDAGAPHIAWVPGTTEIVETACRRDVVLVDTRSGRIVRRLPVVASLSASGDALPLAAAPHRPEVAVATMDGTRVVDTGTGHVSASFGKGRADVVSISPDGLLLAAHRANAPLAVWDLGTGAVRVLRGTPTTDYARILFSPEDKQIVVATSTPGATGEVRVYDRASGHLERTIADSRSAALSPDGSVLAVAQVLGSEGVVSLWSTRTFRSAILARFPIVNAVSLAFSPNGQDLAIGLANGTAGVWSLAGHNRVAAFLGGRSSVSGLTFSPDGKMVVTAEEDGTTEVWSTTTGEEVRIPTNHGEPATMAVTRDRAAAAFFDGTVGVWDVKSARAVNSFRLFRGNVFRAPWLWPALSPDRAFIAYQHRAHGVVQVMRVADHRVIRSFPAQTAYSASFSPDNRRIAVLAPASGFVAALPSGPLRPLQDVRVGMSCGGFAVGQTAFTGSGDLLTASTSCDLIAAWNANTGHLLRLIRNAHTNYSTAGLSRDGKLLAIGSPDATISIWSVLTGHRIALLHGHTGTVVSVAFGGFGHWLASASVDGTVRIWDVATQRTLRVIHGPDFAPEFTPDGDYLITSDHAGTIEVWPACPACGDARALLAVADRRITRDFTKQERTSLLSGF